MAIGEDAGIVMAIAQWIGSVGLPAMFVWNWKLVQWGHRQDLAIRDLENRVGELQKNGTRIDLMQQMLQSVRDDVVELKTLMKMRLEGTDQNSRGRRAGD